MVNSDDDHGVNIEFVDDNRFMPTSTAAEVRCREVENVPIKNQATQKKTQHVVNRVNYYRTSSTGRVKKVKKRFVSK